MSVARRKGMPARPGCFNLVVVLALASLLAQEGVEKLFPAAATGYLTDVGRRGGSRERGAHRVDREDASREDRRRAGGRHASHPRSATRRPTLPSPSGVAGAWVPRPPSVTRSAMPGWSCCWCPSGTGQPGKIRLEVGDGLQGIAHRRDRRAHPRRDAAAARRRRVWPGPRHRCRDGRGAGGAGARRTRLDAGAARAGVQKLGRRGPPILPSAAVCLRRGHDGDGGARARRCGRVGASPAAGILGPWDLGRLGWWGGLGGR